MLRTAVGAALVAAHLAGFVYLAGHSQGDELAIAAPPSIAPSGDGGPGLVHRRWSQRFRGGFVRSVGATQLVGPFQAPGSPACTGRLVIGQRLLDDGAAGDGTIAGVMRQQLDRQLRGLDVFPIGEFQQVTQLSLRWATADASAGSRALLGPAGAPHGYVRASATLAFRRVEVPVTVALVPRRDADTLRFDTRVIAGLEFDSRVVQWVSDKVGASRLATRIAREQIDGALVTVFAPPPPFELSSGQRLRFVYCDAPVEIVGGDHGALPFGVEIGRAGATPAPLPPRRGPGVRPAPAAGTTLAIDLDLDALNAMLFELWRTGWLDQRLAEVGLDRRFNADPLVTEFLSVRLSPLRLALPPVVMPDGAGALRLASDARVIIDDGARRTVGRAFGALTFRFRPAPPPPAPAAGLPLSVELGALELSCERGASTLVPCYGDLVAALRDRGPELHGALTESFARLLADIFVGRRLGARELPAELAIDRVRPALAGGVTLHLELDGRLVAPPR